MAGDEGPLGLVGDKGQRGDVGLPGFPGMNWHSTIFFRKLETK